MKLIKILILVVFLFYKEAIAAQTLGFLEEDGLLVIEIESIAEVPTGWAEEIDFVGYTGSSYFRYAANNQLNNPGVDLLEYPIFIQTAGRYKFQWRNLIAEGASTTDANDSWLRIRADAFYGLQGNNSIVCPKGYDSDLNDCPIDLDDDGNVTPNGSGSDGWFKVYRSGAGDWVWSTNTSDNDGHRIYVQFDSPGVYLIQVSGRSKDHAIDRMVLFNDDYTGDPLDDQLSESSMIDIDLIFKDGYE